MMYQLDLLEANNVIIITIIIDLIQMIAVFNQIIATREIIIIITTTTIITFINNKLNTTTMLILLLHLVPSILQRFQVQSLMSNCVNCWQVTEKSTKSVATTVAPSPTQQTMVAPSPSLSSNKLLTLAA